MITEEWSSKRQLVEGLSSFKTDNARNSPRLRRNPGRPEPRSMPGRPGAHPPDRQGARASIFMPGRAQAGLPRRAEQQVLDAKYELLYRISRASKAS